MTNGFFPFSNNIQLRCRMKFNNRTCEFYVRNELGVLKNRYIYYGFKIENIVDYFDDVIMKMIINSYIRFHRKDLTVYPCGFFHVLIENVTTYKNCFCTVTLKRS